MKTKLLLGILLVALLLLFGWQRQRMSEAETRAETATTAADSLRRRGDSLEAAYHADTVTFNHWHTKWDTLRLPGKADTIPVPVLVAIADSTIQACTLALRTCEERVKTERERGDSLAVAAASWKRVAKGPWLTPRLELTLTPQLDPQAAAELSVGRGRLRLLGRAEVGSDAVVRLGLSWSP
jgi:hypothetical protein